MLSVEIAGSTTRGSLKPVNEDRLVLGDCALSEGGWSCVLTAPCCLGVFDGVSGDGGGNEASGLASSLLIENYIAEGLPDSSERCAEMLGEYASLADADIASMCRSGYVPRGAATTASLIMFAPDGGTATLCVGDSRVYRSRNGILARLSHDDTPMQNLIDAGLPDALLAQTKGIAHVITKALGDGSSFASSISEGFCIEGDCFLVCSDGLTDVVSDSEIEVVLASDLLPRAKVKQLIDAAMHGGTEDNVTVTIAKVLSGTRENEEN